METGLDHPPTPEIKPRKFLHLQDLLVTFLAWILNQMPPCPRTPHQALVILALSSLLRWTCFISHLWAFQALLPGPGMLFLLSASLGSFHPSVSAGTQEKPSLEVSSGAGGSSKPSSLLSFTASITPTCLLSAGSLLHQTSW